MLCCVVLRVVARCVAAVCYLLRVWYDCVALLRWVVLRYVVFCCLGLSCYHSMCKG